LNDDWIAAGHPVEGSELRRFQMVLGKDDQVQVNCIHPSLVETERQWKRIRAEVARTGETEEAVRAKFCHEFGINRYGTVEDVADLVTFIVSSRATWLRGATIDLDGGEIPVL